MRKQYNKEKGYNVVEMWECEWYNLYKSTTCGEEPLKESFSFKHALTEESSKLFGYVQCDIEVPDELKKNSAEFQDIFKSTNVGPHDIGLVMKD